MNEDLVSEMSESDSSFKLPAYCHIKFNDNKKTISRPKIHSARLKNSNTSINLDGFEQHQNGIKSIRLLLVL